MAAGTGPGVAADGSPVAVYLALPAGQTPAIVDSVLPGGSSILELGSGPGRITRPLVDLGHRVTAVDQSAEMLAHVDGTAETVLGDVYSLDLARTFDAVVAGSHLVNAPEAERRRALLEVCRRHVAPGGAVLIERYDPEWAARPAAGHARLGPVDVAFEPITRSASGFRGRVTYRLDDREWTQEFSAANVTDGMLVGEAERAGLRLHGWLDAARTWAHLAPAGPPP